MTPLTLLTIVFIVLKLCSVIAWPWILVILPFIIELVIIISPILLMIILRLVRTMKTRSHLNKLRSQR